MKSAAQGGLSLRPVISCCVCLLAGCVGDKPLVWQSVSGAPINETQRQQAALICEAVAKNAGTRVLPPQGPTVQVRQNVTVNNTVNVGPQGVPMAAPPTAADYRASQEAMEGVGEGIGAGAAALFVGIQRARAERTNFLGCMAERGFIPADASNGR
jgi:hypothetical protein